MPKHVRSIECCYCGGSTLVNLHDANENSLKCGECGAGMAVGKMARVTEAPDAAGWNGERPRNLAPQWQSKRDWRGDDDDDDDDDDRDERSKPKKKKGFFDRLEDLWDDVEDIFD